MATDTARQPSRYLDPALAKAVKDAKERSLWSWREIGEMTGVSHSHLVLIAQGKRVPSNRVLDAVAKVLVLDSEVLASLRCVASSDSA